MLRRKPTAYKNARGSSNLKAPRSLRLIINKKRSEDKKLISVFFLFNNNTKKY